MQARTTLSLVIAAALVARADARQSPSQAPAAPPTFGARTEAVLVDVNVTDRKGRPVTNLSQADFQVFEDNTPQAILTFDRRVPEPSAPVGRAAAAAGLGPGTGGGKGTSTSTQQGPSITALAFDHLSADSRTLAYQAAQRFLRERQADELAGVFIVDQALRVVAPYTTDGGKLSAAVQTVGERRHEQSGPRAEWVSRADRRAFRDASRCRRRGSRALRRSAPIHRSVANAQSAGDHALVAEIEAMTPHGSELSRNPERDQGRRHVQRAAGAGRLARGDSRSQVGDLLLRRPHGPQLAGSALPRDHPHRQPLERHGLHGRRDGPARAERPAGDAALGAGVRGDGRRRRRAPREVPRRARGQRARAQAGSRRVARDPRGSDRRPPDQQHERPRGRRRAASTRIAATTISSAISPPIPRSTGDFIESASA